MVLSSSKTLKISRDCLGLRVRYLNRVVSRIFDEELRAHDLKSNQFTILVAVTRKSGIRAVDLAQLLEIEKSSLSRNLKKMIEQGWLTNDDGLAVTTSGERLLSEAYPAWVRGQARVKARLGSRGAESLYEAASSVFEQA